MNDILRERLRACFTVEDREVINSLMSEGKADMIASVLNMDTHEQEAALQELLDTIRIPIDPEGSQVLRELEEAAARGEEVITSPEEEAKWQAKLDAEKKTKKSNKQTEVKEADATLLEDIEKTDEAGVEAAEGVVEENSDADLTKAEIVNILKERGVKFDPNAKKADLKQLL